MNGFRSALLTLEWLNCVFSGLNIGCAIRTYDWQNAAVGVSCGLMWLFMRHQRKQLIRGGM